MELIGAKPQGTPALVLGSGLLHLRAAIAELGLEVAATRGVGAGADVGAGAGGH